MDDVSGETNMRPILLGRPFMVTTKTIIDVQNGKLTMTVLDETIEFKLFDALSYPSGADDCSFIDVLDTGIDGVFRDDDLEELLKWDWEDQEKPKDISESVEEVDNEEEFEEMVVSDVSVAQNPLPKKIHFPS
ncbi:hypothetical protein Ddye_016597 [Dipteronia dyeriana]|uniref:Reverse transcriptase domain-containing protein n=1 Tax=Dipteronia dyeriana TaxID=168575 RepID=A0AAD9U7Q3_9ROSI|nr:hypothetical protein Ddye_016597 [Dipteronia dyeriana]